MKDELIDVLLEFEFDVLRSINLGILNGLFKIGAMLAKRE